MTTDHVEATVEQDALATTYRLAVPAVWQSFSTAPERFRPQVHAWLLRRFADRSRDETATQRRAVEQQMVELVEGPAGRYAVRLLVLVIEPAGVPVTATCIVSVVPQDLSQPEQRQVWAQRMAEGALRSEVEQLGRNEAVVVVSERDAVAPHDLTAQEVLAAGARAVGEPEPDGVPDAEAEGLVREASRGRVVEVFVPVPDQARTLLLSFSTPLVSMFEPLTELFLTMAATLQWRDEDGQWR
jgi:hypothetical protein